MGYSNVLIIYMLLIVKMFKLPGLIRCGPHAGYVSSLHLPDPGDCLNLRRSPFSASSHSCIVHLVLDYTARASLTTVAQWKQVQECYV